MKRIRKICKSCISERGDEVYTLPETHTPSLTTISITVLFIFNNNLLIVYNNTTYGEVTVC